MGNSEARAVVLVSKKEKVKFADGWRLLKMAEWFSFSAIKLLNFFISKMRFHLYCPSDCDEQKMVKAEDYFQFMSHRFRHTF